MSVVAWQPTEEKAAEVVRVIAEEANPIAIVIFGSFARRDMNRDSDFDVLVVVNDTVEVCWRLAANLRRKVSYVDMPMDILVVKKSELERQKRLPGNFYRNAIREGIVVYGTV